MNKLLMFQKPIILYCSVFILLLVTIRCSNKEERARALQALDTYQQRLQFFESSIQSLNSAIPDIQAELAVSQDRVNRAKGFQLLRTPAERDEQIKETTSNYLRLQRTLEETEKSLQAYTDSVTTISYKIENTKRFLKDE